MYQPEDGAMAGSKASLTSRRVALLAASLAALAAAFAQPAGAHAATTCTWGGTPGAETGTLTISPGITNVPSTQPLAFRATGTLAGGPACHGTMQFVGSIGTGSSCAFATFYGDVKGLQGVARYEGDGSVDVPSRLFDKDGRLVGIENAQIVTYDNF